MPRKKKVLMICLGNICRSPIAEAVFADIVKKLDIQGSWEVDSAALIGYHTGKGPDHRAMVTLRERGITNYSHKARPIVPEDFTQFDWIFGMDNSNIEELNNIKPNDSTAKIELLGSYDPQGDIIIRDPYYDNGRAGFEKAYDQCVRSVSAFLEKHTKFEATSHPTKCMAETKFVLMVCLGNSCRSPIAEAVFRHEISKLGMDNLWKVDSAALLNYHVGNNPEPRALATLIKAGITNYSHTARQITPDDFYKFDWIFAMDSRVWNDLCRIEPKDCRAKIEPLGLYDPQRELNIRDPLFDHDSTGFERAFEQAARSIKAFLEQHANTQ